MIVRFGQRLRSFASHQKRGNNQMAILERLLWKYYSLKEMNEKVVLYLQRLAGWRTHSQQMRRLRPSSSITLQEVCTANASTTTSLLCNERPRPFSGCVLQPRWRALEAYHVLQYATRRSAGMTVESSDKGLVQPRSDFIVSGPEDGVSSRKRSHANAGSSAQGVSSLVLDHIHHA